MMIFFAIFFVFDVVLTVWNVHQAMNGDASAPYLAVVSGAFAVLMLIMFAKSA